MKNKLMWTSPRWYSYGRVLKFDLHKVIRFTLWRNRRYNINYFIIGMMMTNFEKLFFNVLINVPFPKKYQKTKVFVKIIKILFISIWRPYGCLRHGVCTWRHFYNCQFPSHRFQVVLFCDFITTKITELHISYDNNYISANLFYPNNETIN